MFQRFADRARRVVVLAQHEARTLNHDRIGTEHILLALLREGDGGAAQVLAASGLDLYPVRQQVLRGHGEAEAPAAPPPAAAGELLGLLSSIVTRLDAIEQRLRQSPPA
jgi:ATP-dependent Clp protease ATP-binding subunit ClpA